jgi:hypothetical protein
VIGWLLSNAIAVVMRRKGDVNPRNVRSAAKKRLLRKRPNH